MLSSLPWCFRTKSSIVLQDARDKALLCGMATWIPPLTSLAQILHQTVVYDYRQVKEHHRFAHVLPEELS